MVRIFDKYYKDPKREPVIIDFVRTPLGAKKGTLKYLRGDDLAIHVWSIIRKRWDGKVEFEKLGAQGLTDSICGCNSQIGACALDIGKTVALSAGFPTNMPGVSLNRQCASGMTAVAFAYGQIAGGDKEAVICGGVESQNTYPIMADMNVADAGPGGANITVPPNIKMNDNPYLLKEQKEWETYTGMPASMQGQIFSAEVMGRVWHKKSGKSFEEFRGELDRSAILSHTKAMAHFEDRAREIEPIDTPKLDEKGVPIFSSEGRLVPGQTVKTAKDESVRDPKGMKEKLAKLEGIVKRKTGYLTAGNSCPTSDGSCAMLMTSRGYAEEHGLKIKGTIESFASVGTDVILMLTGPIAAIPLALKRANLKLDDMSVIEINEAFSTVVIASAMELGFTIDDPRLNPLGGAMAIGHPTGMTGCRLLGSALQQLEKSGKKYGIGSLCVGFGMGIAGIVKREGA